MTHAAHADAATEAGSVRPRGATHRRAIGEVLGALVAGSLLYVLARPRGLVAFVWFEALGLGRQLDAARAVTRPMAHVLPSFVLFSVPDGLWAFAFTQAMVVVWSGRWSRASAPWILLGPALAIGSELGQAAGVVPGTFDVVDLLALSLGSAVGLARLVKPRMTSALRGDQT